MGQDDEHKLTETKTNISWSAMVLVSPGTNFLELNRVRKLRGIKFGQKPLAKSLGRGHLPHKQKD